MDAAESILKYIAVPALSIGLTALLGLLVWVIRTQGTLQATMSGLKGSVDNLGRDIADLTIEIRGERLERNHLASRVGEHDVRIENLDGRVSVLERGLERRQPREES